MELLGLTPLSLGLTLAGLGAAVVALYLLKNEQRRVIVPSVLLWDSLLQKKRGVAWARKLRRLLSMLLALVIAALLAWAIADPRRLAQRSDRRLLILIDASASMQAKDVNPNRLEAAKSLARKLIAGLGGTDRALVAQLDAQVTPLSNLTDDRSALNAAIERAHATDLAGDLLAGARFASDVLHDHSDCDLFVISDGNLTGVDGAQRLLKQHAAIRLHYLRVGKSKRNVGIEHFSVRRYPLDKTHTESIVKVHNFGDRAETAKLRLFAGRALLYEESLSLPAGATQSRTFSDLAATQGALEARIELQGGPDALAADDRAYAALPARRPSRVLLVTEGNRYLEAALLLDEYLEVDEVLPKDYVNSQGWDAVIFDATLPAAAPNTNALYLSPAPTSAQAFAPFKLKGELTRPYFDRVDDAHPLTRGLALRDVNIAKGLSFEPDRNDTIIGRTEGGAPLLFEGVRDGKRFVTLAFDIRDSDLPLRVSFPLFVLSAIDELVGEEGHAAARGLAGDPIRVQVPDGLQSAELEAPDQSKAVVSIRDRQARLSLAQAGIYRLRAGGFQSLLAANVPAEREGDIAPRERLLVGAADAPTQDVSSFGGSRLWPVLAALALLLLSLEWLSFHRRWTV